MMDAVEDEKLIEKCLPIMNPKFYSDRWVAHNVTPHHGHRRVGCEGQRLLPGGERDPQKFIYESDSGEVTGRAQRFTTRELRESEPVM